jgi:hypothetical protein
MYLNNLYNYLSYRSWWNGVRMYSFAIRRVEEHASRILTSVKVQNHVEPCTVFIKGDHVFIELHGHIYRMHMISHAKMILGSDNGEIVFKAGEINSFRL